VSRADFHIALDSLNTLLESPLSEQQIRSLMEALATNDNDVIDYYAFLDGIVVEKAVEKKE